MDEFLKRALKYRLYASSPRVAYDAGAAYVDLLRSYRRQFQIEYPRPSVVKKKQPKQGSGGAAAKRIAVERKIFKATNVARPKSAAQAKQKIYVRSAKKKESAPKKQTGRQKAYKMQQYYEYIQQKQREFTHGSENSSFNSVYTQEARDIMPLLQEMKHMSKRVSGATMSRKCFALANRVYFDLWQLEEKLRQKAIDEEVESMVQMQAASEQQHPDEKSVSYDIDANELSAEEEAENISNYVYMSTVILQRSSQLREVEAKITHSTSKYAILSDVLLEYKQAAEEPSSESYLKEEEEIEEEYGVEESGLSEKLEDADALDVYGTAEQSEGYEEYFYNENSDESLKSRPVYTQSQPKDKDVYKTCETYQQSEESRGTLQLVPERIAESPERLYQLIYKMLADALQNYEITPKNKVVYEAQSVAPCSPLVNSQQTFGPFENVAEISPNFVKSANLPDDSEVNVYTVIIKPCQVERVDISTSVARSKSLGAEEVRIYEEQTRKISDLHYKLERSDQQEEYEMLMKRNDYKYSPGRNEQLEVLKNSVNEQLVKEVQPEDIYAGLESIKDILDFEEDVVLYPYRENEANEQMSEYEIEQPVHGSKLSYEEIFGFSDDEGNGATEGLVLDVQQQAPYAQHGEQLTEKELELLRKIGAATGEDEQKHTLLQEERPKAFYVPDMIANETYAWAITYDFVGFVSNYASSELGVAYFQQHQLIIDMLFELLERSHIGVFAGKCRINSVAELRLLSNQCKLRNVGFYPMGTAFQQYAATAIIRDGVAQFAYKQLMRDLRSRQNEENAVFSAMDTVEHCVHADDERIRAQMLEEIAGLVVEQLVDDAAAALLE